ncbi:hypothetical protein ONS96_014739 [Cadophora gregata f. sp. sojae]|nr:hypothetical protein ONS96_014739 [Cadophora gregata f. sp. sojae]
MSLIMLVTLKRTRFQFQSWVGIKCTIGLGLNPNLVRAANGTKGVQQHVQMSTFPLVTLRSSEKLMGVASSRRVFTVSYEQKIAVLNDKNEKRELTRLSQLVCLLNEHVTPGQLHADGTGYQYPANVVSLYRTCQGQVKLNKAFMTRCRRLSPGDSITGSPADCVREWRGD